MKKLPKICLSLSSWFKYLARVTAGNKSIIADALTLPGWFVLDCYLIHQVPLDVEFFTTGFEWITYPMPDEWCKEMRK